MGSREESVYAGRPKTSALDTSWPSMPGVVRRITKSIQTRKYPLRLCQCEASISYFCKALLSSFTVTRCLFVSSQRLRPDPKGNPSMASITRVNNLLKISLLFSLVTSVLCTISLQWLRVYQPRPHTPVEQAYALFKTRTTKLHRWNIRRGLTILPLLLQLAVVLFLGGLLDPLEIFGSSCTALVPILGMMVFTRYIWRLTKIENILETWVVYTRRVCTPRGLQTSIIKYSTRLIIFNIITTYPSSSLSVLRTNWSIMNRTDSLENTLCYRRVLILLF